MAGKKVNIEDLSIRMELQRKGIELRIRDKDDNHLGDMVVSSSGLNWCQGKTTRNNGKKKSWDDLIEFFNS